MPRIKQNKLSPYKNKNAIRKNSPLKRCTGLEQGMKEAVVNNLQQKSDDVIIDIIKKEEFEKLEEENERGIEQKMRELIEKLPKQDRLRQLMDEKDKPFISI